MTIGDFASSKTQTSKTSGLELPPIILGGAAFSKFYNSDDELQRHTPESTLLFAFRNGINAIDTSPYYGISESVIGSILSKPQFRSEFPRSSYHILTKCGRYGPKVEDFDYSPDRLIRSVKKSCFLMGTEYLDAVYLHDVEFLAEDPDGFKQGGHFRSPLNGHLAQLDEPRAKKYNSSYGPGDDTIILAIETLFQLKKLGLIRKVGISGYPLGTLLRLSHLIKAQLGYPLDLVMSYACLSLQNDTLNNYLPHFEAAGVNQILSASPFGMGLLTTRGPPGWHPAPQALRETVKIVGQTLQEDFKTSLERVSLCHSLNFRFTVVGLSSIEEVKLALESLDEVRNKKFHPEALQAQALVKSTLQSAGFRNWSWAT